MWKMDQLQMPCVKIVLGAMHEADHSPWRVSLPRSRCLNCSGDFEEYGPGE